VPVISDWWDGLDAFFEPGREILIAESAEDVLRHLHQGDGLVGVRARARVLRSHTADHRAAELERHVAEVGERVGT
jgi:spore maturation protein CgeB